LVEEVRRGSIANPYCKFTLVRGYEIILCYPSLFFIFNALFTTPFRRHTMKFNRSLGLTLIAAALVTVYGCGKEEPKTAAVPAAPAAPAMPEITVKVGHVGPTTGPQAHLGKDNENGARLAIDDANGKNIVIDGKKV